MNGKPRIGRVILLWVLVAASLYPALALLNLGLFNFTPDTLMPSLTAYISKRYLAFDLLGDWLSSLPLGALFATLVIVVATLFSRMNLNLLPVVVTINLMLTGFCFLLFGQHLAFYPAPLLFGNMAIAAYYFFAAPMGAESK